MKDPNAEPNPSIDAQQRPARSLGEIYEHHFQSARRERLFLSSVGFFAAFKIIRVVTHAIRAGVGPFQNISAGETHVHHLVFGIALLLLVGYLWLVQVDAGFGHTSKALSRIMAVLYGVGAALTLDEFALWLNLKDVYWEREGRESIDAILLFGGLLSVGFWGGPFFREVSREFGRIFRRRVIRR